MPSVPVFGTVIADFGKAFKKSGTIYVEPKNGFLSSQVGKAVLVHQADVGDEDECTQAVCTGSIVSLKRMRVRYIAVGGPIRGTKQLNYVIST